MSLGDVIRQKRIGLGLTQLEFAKMIGIGQSSVANYEKLRRTPSFDAICKITSALGLTIDDLIREAHQAENLDVASQRRKPAKKKKKTRRTA